MLRYLLTYRPFIEFVTLWSIIVPHVIQSSIRHTNAVQGTYLSACARTVQEHTTYSLTQALARVDPEQSSDNMHQWFKRYTKGPVGKQHGTYAAFVKFVALWKQCATFNYQDTASLSDQYIEGMLELLAQADSDFFYSPFLADFATTILQTWKPSSSDLEKTEVLERTDSITSARKLARLYLEHTQSYLYTSPAYIKASYEQPVRTIATLRQSLHKITVSECGTYIIGLHGQKNGLWIRNILTGVEKNVSCKPNIYEMVLCDHGTYVCVYGNKHITIYDVRQDIITCIPYPESLENDAAIEIVRGNSSLPIIACDFLKFDTQKKYRYLYDIPTQTWIFLHAFYRNASDEKPAWTSDGLYCISQTNTTLRIFTPDGNKCGTIILDGWTEDSGYYTPHDQTLHICQHTDDDSDQVDETRCSLKQAMIRFHIPSQTTFTQKLPVQVRFICASPNGTYEVFAENIDTSLEHTHASSDTLHMYNTHTLCEDIIQMPFGLKYIWSNTSRFFMGYTSYPASTILWVYDTVAKKLTTLTRDSGPYIRKDPLYVRASPVEISGPLAIGNFNNGLCGVYVDTSSGTLRLHHISICNADSKHSNYILSVQVPSSPYCIHCHYEDLRGLHIQMNQSLLESLEIE